LLYDNAPAHKAASVQVFANFWPKKMLNPLSPPPPVLSRFISTRLLPVPQV
jgi:hypothetical protein